MLGLKTLDVLDKTIKAVDPSNTVLKLYKDIQKFKTEKNIFEMINQKETEGLFQIESDMFKGLIEIIKPDSLNDITALTSIGRPGPLQNGMHTQYANRKNGTEKIEEPVKNTLDILQDTYGTIIYQESVMLMAIRIAKVNENQADSLFRKAIA